MWFLMNNNEILSYIWIFFLYDSHFFQEFYSSVRLNHAWLCSSHIGVGLSHFFLSTCSAMPCNRFERIIKCSPSHTYLHSHTFFSHTFASSQKVKSCSFYLQIFQHGSVQSWFRNLHYFSSSEKSYKIPKVSECQQCFPAGHLHNHNLQCSCSHEILPNRQVGFLVIVFYNFTNLYDSAWMFHILGKHILQFEAFQTKCGQGR